MVDVGSMVVRAPAWLLCSVALVFLDLGCARTDLLPGFHADTGGSSADRAGASGGSSSGGSSGSGSSGVGGMASAGTGVGGTFVSVGGAPGDGALGGRLVQHAELFALSVGVYALNAAPDGRVALGGSFEGRLDLGGQVLTSQSEGAGFVAVYDANSRLQWARSVDGVGSEQVTGLAFTPDGAVVAQGFTAAPAPRGKQFAVRFDERGNSIWRQDFGNHLNQPSKVVIGQDGDAWLGGTLDHELAFGRQTLSHDGSAAYLLRLNAAGELVDARKVLPEPCATSTLSDLAADDAGRVIVAGFCGDVSHGFLQNRDVNGTIVFEKRITGALPFSLEPLRVAADHAGRITVGASVVHSLENGEGEKVFQTPGSSGDLWFAQYTPGGDRLWQRTYAHGGPRAALTALATDPSGNILALSDCYELRFGQMEIASRPDRVGSPPNCVLKLRPDGAPVWGRLLDGGMRETAMTADATAHVWLGGEFIRQTWFDDHMILGNETTAGLVLRLSP